MHPDMLNDNQGPWPLSIESPTVAQLMEWAIRLYPNQPKSQLPDEIKIQRILHLYMRAQKALAQWEEFKHQFASDEMSILDKRLVASTKDEDDTLRPWLAGHTNAKEERVRFKGGATLTPTLDQSSLRFFKIITVRRGRRPSSLKRYWKLWRPWQQHLGAIKFS